MKGVIRKYRNRIWVLLLTLVMLVEGAAAQEISVRSAFISGGLPAGSVYVQDGITQAQENEGRILLAKKKKKKKKKTNQNQSDWNQKDQSQDQSARDQNYQNAGKEQQSAGSGSSNRQSEKKTEDETELTVTEDGTYTSKEEVALYIHLYDHLPDNYITKSEAEDLGWDSREGNLDEVAPGKSIGGNRFGNYEGLLPEKNGRKYWECDIDFDGGYRGAKRIIYSNDGLIYYTEDHYKTFEKLY